MGKAAPHRLTPKVALLGRALRSSERAALRTSIRALLAWQRDLARWPRVRGVPDATPYVSLYAHGKLRGCFGTHEGAPTERLGRAFLLALTDPRYGEIAPEERHALAADVAFIRSARPVRADEATASIEPGTDGIALADTAQATVLLPSVARERGYDANGMLDVLWRKAGSSRQAEGLVWILDVEEVSSHGVAQHDGMRAARAFLETLVGRDGAMAFDMDAATGVTRSTGVMRHGRIAVAIEALASLGSRKVTASRAWLEREIARGLAGDACEGWPDRPDRVLGTLALAVRAGLSLEQPLARYADTIDAATCSPWHAAQAASVLGKGTPAVLWSLCVRALDARPHAPYTLMAARVRGDAAIVERCANALIASIGAERPFAGGAAFKPIPETAMTAVTIEALAGLRSADARRAVRLARDFVAARQVLDVPAAMNPRALGAFRASTVTPVLRCDVTGHAILALRS